MQQKRIPAITVDQMREVDRIMIEEIGVSIQMMMENASKNISIIAKKMLDGSVKNKNIVVLSGKGNNGGDGLGAARHLINFGAKVTCVLAEESGLSEDSLVQYNALRNIEANVVSYSEENQNKIQEYINNSDLIIDSLLGYNLIGNPRPPYSNLIELANKSKRMILAIDIPSGLSGDTGVPSNTTIKANTTLTLALPKTGLYKTEVRQYVGKLYIADLSVPKIVYNKIGVDIPLLFEKESIVEVI